MNLINKLSQNLQNKIEDYKILSITVEYGELNVKSEYTMDQSYYEAIEAELRLTGDLV